MNLSSHASRWLVAAVLVPLLLAAIFLAPPFVFYLVVAVAGLLAWSEFFAMCLSGERRVLMLLGMVGVALVMLGARLDNSIAHGAALVVAVCLGCLYFLLRFEKTPSIIDHTGRFVLGQVYIGLFLSFLARLFALDHGPNWVLFALAVTFLGDTGAFYTGRTWGRHPLYPAVSPKKTREGLWGGLAGGGLAAGVIAVFLLPAPWYEAALFGVFLGFWGAVGDLFESMLKRSAGIKDSGSLLRGHGGVMDRIDGLIFNAPIVYFYAVARGF
ncbi:MAG: phosphatidate cytidylyltransferase [Thermodesulfobacteriota bacterium]|nr:phosphatidate cytidylyltransferase [Thermodesulfobacteriota bacterium]